MRNEIKKDKNNTFDSKSELFGKYKKYFIVMFIMIAIFIICFFLTSFNVLPLWAIDIVLVPIAIVAIAVWYKARKR